MDRIALLQGLLKLDTTNPPGNEGPAAELIEAALSGAGIATELIRSPEGRVNLIGRVEGPPEVPALVLLSHTDVVAVEPGAWTHDPFGGEIDGGFIWGRGALDMKSIAAMHAAAAIDLAGSGATPARELIVVAVADEEAGGLEGAAFLLEERATALGFGEDRPPPEVVGEGTFGLTGVLDRPVMPIARGEKSALWLDVHATGEPGHGSHPPARQATLELARFVDEVTGFGPPRIHPVMREQLAALARAASGPRALIFRTLASAAGPIAARALGGRFRTSPIGRLLADTTTLTSLNAGYKHNVVPGEAKASFDCRLLPDTDPEGFMRALAERGAPRGIELREVLRHGAQVPVSGTGTLYGLLENVSRTLPDDPLPIPSLSPAITDIRYFRAKGAQGYGWVPLVLAPELLATIHGHDERVPVDGFESAVDATAELVRRAAAVGATLD